MALAKVSLISTLAECILFLGIVQVNKHITDRKFTYLCVHSIVSTVEILALRRLDLIATKGTIVISGYTILRIVFFSRIENKLF